MRLPGRTAVRGPAAARAVAFSHYVRAARIIALLVLGLSLATLAGWLLGIEWLRRAAPGYAGTPPDSAIGFVIGSIAVILALPRRGSPARRIGASVLAALLSLLGTVLLGWHVSGFGSELRRIPVPEWLAAGAAAYVSAEAYAAVGFILCGVAVLGLVVRRPRQYLTAQIAAFGAGFLALHALAGYIADALVYPRGERTLPMTLGSAFGLAGLALAILLARPDRGLMRTVTAMDIGGQSARRLLPAAALAPFALIVLDATVRWVGLTGPLTGLPLVIMITAAMFVALIWWNAEMLGRVDAQRSAAENARRAALDRARAERWYLHAIVQQMPGGVIVADAPSGRYVLVNEGVAEILRHPLSDRETLYDAGITRGFHPDGRPYEPEDWPIHRAVTRGEIVQEEEIFILRGDDTCATIWMSAAPVRAQDGRVIAGVGVLFDVTEIKRVERERMEVAERLRLALEAGRMGTWQWAARTNRFEWSPELEAIHGLPPGSFPGTLEAFRELIHPDDRDRVMAAFEAVFRGSDLFHSEYRALRPGGETFWIEAWGRVVHSPDGQTEYVVGVSRDVTETVLAHATEARLAAIVEASEDAIIANDLNGVITNWNRGAERLYGYTAEEAVGRPTSMLVPSEVPNDEPLLLSRIRRGERVEHFETVHRARDGRRIDVSLTLSPIRDAAGKIIGASIIARDITERKKAEAERARLLESSERRREELQRVLESRSRLMRGFSHDVKNPLGAADGQLALLEAGVLGRLAPKQLAGVARARRSIHTALRLIDSLSELARAEAGKIHVVFEDMDVRAIAREVADEHRAAAESKGLALELELPAERVMARSDPERLRQILGNLVSNAVKYTRNGEIRIHVAEHDSPPRPLRRGRGPWVSIAVSDTGPGIPHDKLDAIFSEFIRLDPDASRGAGLGLSISRHLARAIGGEITVDSKPGHGSTFTLWVPREPAAARAQEEEPPDASRERAADGGAKEHPDTPGGPITDRGTLQALIDTVLSQLEGITIFMVDPGGHIACWNQAAERATGLAADRVIGKPYSILFADTGPDSQRVEDSLQRALAHGSHVRNVRIAGPDGTPFAAREIVAPVRDDSGRLTGFAVIFDQMTAAHRATEAGRSVRDELRRARDAAEAASRAKSEFLSVMSHELRTPLTAVIGYAEILESGMDGPLNDQQRQRLRRIAASAHHLVELIEEILAFSRLESGRESVSTAPVELTGLAREAAATIAPSAAEKGIAFQTCIPDVPVHARTDAAKVRRILLNLLTNAVNFTSEGEIVLEMEQVGDDVVFRIRDTGIGIAPRDLEHIFEPFWQAASSLTREVGGTGLGLAVAQRLARMIGGDITVESEPGKGSTFTVTLPRDAGAAR